LNLSLIYDRYRAAKLPGARKIETLTDAPVGRKRLTIIDPEDFPINLICGQEPVERIDQPQIERLVYNYEDETSRKGNSSVSKRVLQQYIRSVDVSFPCRANKSLHSLATLDYVFRTLTPNGSFMCITSTSYLQIGYM
jgi:hypothetical protein